ncbi:hypothetical protein R3P82_07710 [Dietzia maris]|uniref:Uncharacterized protein n=1 Tax=Dietzia maris TaxID=37915 RepID=A0AAE4QVM3_9ACTN|nr:hypothetical protein [Dietzia maris]MDV6299000.1 hypothetical protein [Dietzia maris]
MIVEPPVVQPPAPPYEWKPLPVAVGFEGGLNADMKNEIGGNRRGGVHLTVDSGLGRKDDPVLLNRRAPLAEGTSITARIELEGAEFAGTWANVFRDGKAGTMQPDGTFVPIEPGCNLEKLEIEPNVIELAWTPKLVKAESGDYFRCVDPFHFHLKYPGGSPGQPVTATFTVTATDPSGAPVRVQGTPGTVYKGFDYLYASNEGNLTWESSAFWA